MSKILNILLKLKELVLALSALAIVFLNIWLGTKLNPVIQNIKDNTNSIHANEHDIVDLKDNSEKIAEDVMIIREDVGFIRGKIDSYER